MFAHFFNPVVQIPGTIIVRTGALLLYSSDPEQGFRIEMCGDPKRSVIDIEESN